METDTDARIPAFVFFELKIHCFPYLIPLYPLFDVFSLSRCLPIQYDKIYIFRSLSLQKISDTIITCEHNRFPRTLLKSIYIYICIQLKCTNKKKCQRALLGGFFSSRMLFHTFRCKPFAINPSTCCVSHLHSTLTLRRDLKPSSVRGPAFAARR
jgi:hypothetical protein